MDSSSKTPAEIFALQTKWFRETGRFRTIQERKERLLKLKKWIKAHEEDIVQALHKDFNKPEREVLFTELLTCVRELRETLANMKKWSSDRPVKTPLLLIGTRSKVIVEPKGVVLIIAPWNFPFNLTIGPMVQAIAAGNAVFLKPSEVSSHTSELIARMVQELFPEEEVVVYNGGAGVSGELLKLPFDHIFFTGSVRVGKIVMEAAAKHLTSVTLELGGRNPVIVDQSANLRLTARRLAWGKCMNAGQSCIAPNTVFVHESQYDALKKGWGEAVKTIYGEQMREQMASIVNERNHERLQGLLENAISAGADELRVGVDHPESRFIAPRWIGKTSPEMAIMQEEIFGPMMAVVTYQNEAEIFKFLDKTPKPLVSYIFSGSRKNTRRLLGKLSGGATLINETTVHFVHSELPFGGVGESGMGRGHGHSGFLAFSNERSVLKQRKGLTTVLFATPPFTKLKKKVLSLFIWKL